MQHILQIGVIQKIRLQELWQPSAVTPAATTSLAFFAPGLSDQPYVVYAVKCKDSTEKFIDLKGSSPDFTNRINNIYGYLTLPEARKVLSASLAQSMLQRYPDAVKIRVAMVVQQIPDIYEYRNGERSHWRFWFQNDFGVNNTATSQQYNHP